MQKLIATRELRYAGQNLVAGDPFEATEKEATVLKAIGKAEDAPPPKAKRERKATEPERKEPDREPAEDRKTPASPMTTDSGLVPGAADAPEHPADASAAEGEGETAPKPAPAPPQPAIEPAVEPAKPRKRKYDRRDMTAKE